MIISQIKDLYSIVMHANGNILIAVALASILTVCLHLMVPQDRIEKKLALMGGIVLTGCILSVDQKSKAKTCQLLYSFLAVQFIFMGLSSLFVPKIKILLITISFCFVNGMGLLQAVSNNYHQQLYARSDNSVKMLFFVVGGFCGVWIFDKILAETLNFSADSRRKIFHVIPLILIPKLFFIDYTFFSLMLAGSFYLFIQLEILRFFILPQFSTEPKLIRWMSDLNTQREKYLWYTHLNLILGLGLTYFYFNDEFVHMSLILALGDAMAAIVGKKWGKTKIYQNKTFEGLLAFCLTIFGVMYFWPMTHDVNFIAVSSIFCGLVELFSGEIDNIALPVGFITIHKIYYSYHSLI